MNHYPILIGTHISLGAMQREYINLFLSGANNPEVVRGTLIKPPVTLEAELQWYDAAIKKSDVLFAILKHEEKDDFRYIGHTGLHNIMWPDATATSGTIIIDSSCFGKGYGKEAKLLLLFEAFRNRGLRKVCSRVKAFNGNSWGHLLACGYQQIGRHKAHHFYNGGFIDSVDFEIFRENWEVVWEKYQRTKTLPKLSAKKRKCLQKETGDL
jgi:RimJ/RimL family protein N-acetyltransferase